MFLKEVHDQLVSSELSKHAAGESGTLNPEWADRINLIIQAGIADLNKLFAIRENELLLRTKLGKDIYELTSTNAVSSGNPYAFIIDSVESPFRDDIMQIFRVTDSNGNSLWLNTDVAYQVPNENIYGVRPNYFVHQGINFTAYNTIKLHKGHDLGDLLVQYKAKAKPLGLIGSTGDPLDPSEVFIDLPDHFLNALCAYVGSRFFNPAGAETIGNGMYHEGQNYAAVYQNEIKSLKDNLGSIASIGETTNFYRNAWA